MVALKAIERRLAGSGRKKTSRSFSNCCYCLSFPKEYYFQSVSQPGTPRWPTTRLIESGYTQWSIKMKGSGWERCRASKEKKVERALERHVGIMSLSCLFFFQGVFLEIHKSRRVFFLFWFFFFSVYSIFFVWYLAYHCDSMRGAERNQEMSSPVGKEGGGRK